MPVDEARGRMDVPGAQGSAAAARPPRIRIVAWRDGATSELDDIGAIGALLEDGETRVWVDVASADHRGADEVATLIGLHPLVVEDITERNQRAKLEETDDTIHLVLFAIAFAGEIHEVEIDLVLRDRMLLTVHDPAFDPFALPQLRGGAGPLLERGPDFLLYAISDGLVDGYFPVLDALGDELDALQDEVIAKATTWTLERLFSLKRELIRVRRATSPAREIFNQLTNRDLPLISAEHVVYFRDVYDHLIRVTDELDNDRELVSGTLEVYLSTINNNLSAIMKRLTGVTVILAGIGALAGIFGMSESAGVTGIAGHGGFWLVTAVIGVLAAITALLLRRNDWI